MTSPVTRALPDIRLQDALDALEVLDRYAAFTTKPPDPLVVPVVDGPRFTQGWATIPHNVLAWMWSGRGHGTISRDHEATFTDVVPGEDPEVLRRDVEQVAARALTGAHFATAERNRRMQEDWEAQTVLSVRTDDLAKSLATRHEKQLRLTVLGLDAEAGAVATAMIDNGFMGSAAELVAAVRTATASSSHAQPADRTSA